MREYRFLIKHIVWIFMLSTFMCGCYKDLTGYEKIVGTATINGKNYKESTRWAWNYTGYPSSMRLIENYKVIHFIARLSPETAGEPSYWIYFYVSVEESQFKTDYPYQIDFYTELDSESFSWLDVIPYFSENRNKILREDADGIAYAVSNASEVIPLKGELVLESINSQSKVCHGYYSLTSPENDSYKLVIEGKFETMTAIINCEY
jgi:hypothetical protein